MLSKYVYKFGVQHDKAWGWHAGIHFCITPADVFVHREIYLFICLGHHDFSIGFLNFCVDEEEL